MAGFESSRWNQLQARKPSQKLLENPLKKSLEYQPRCRKEFSDKKNLKWQDWNQVGESLDPIEGWRALETTLENPLKKSLKHQPRYRKEFYKKKA